jgi:uncharacterized Zn finger protein (UPF0148 family)
MTVPDTCPDCGHSVAIHTDDDDGNWFCPICNSVCSDGDDE